MISEISSSYPLLFTLFWQSSLFITAGLIVSFLLKRHPARAHQVLLLSMIAAVTVPLLSRFVKYMELGIFVEEPVVAISPADDFIPLSNAPLPAINPPSFYESVQVTEVLPPFEAESENFSLPWRKILLFGWIAASAVLLARLLLTFILGMRLVKKAQPFEHPKITESIKSATSKLGVRENLVVNSSKSISSPVIWCWNSNPILLLPSDRRFSNDKIDWVGIHCHELAHLKRRDHIAGLFSELIVCILPWHPLLWWAKMRLINLSERACDDWVIAAGGCGMNYAESLLDLVPVKQMAFVPAVVHSKNDLKGRVMRIVKENYGNPRLSKKWFLSVLLITVCIALTVAFAQTRPARETEEGVDTEMLKPRIYTLKNADPIKMAELLNTLFNENNENLSTKMAFAEVAGTKKIIAMSNFVEGYDVADSLIAVLDEQNMAFTPEIIQLQNTNSEEVKMIIDLILSYDDNITLITNPLQNQIIVIASSEDTEKVGQIIRRLDKPKDQILIDSMILNVSVTFLEEVGLDPNYQGTILDDLQVSFLLRAIEANEDSKILAKPKILVDDNTIGTISTIDEILFVTGFNEPESQFEVATPVYEQKDVGLKYEFRPRVRTDDKNSIDMSININNSQIVGSEERMFNEKYKATVPMFTEMASTTNMIIHSGATLLIDCSIANPNENETDSASEQKRQIMLVKPTIINSQSAD